MSDFTVRTEIDTKQINYLLLRAENRAPVAISRALNRTGGPVERAFLRHVRKVLGLKSHPYAKRPLGSIVKRRTSTKKSRPALLRYSTAGFGRGLPAIYYQPKEAPAGASINWLGSRRTIPASFYLSGKFPRRRRSGISDRVSERLGSGKWNLGRPRGPGLPDAMSQSGPRSTWEGEAGRRLPQHLKAALEAILRGY